MIMIYIIPISTIIITVMMIVNIDEKNTMIDIPIIIIINIIFIIFNVI